MNEVTQLLTEIAPGLEAQVKPRLSGFMGAIVRAYLPQHWTFETENGTATLSVDLEGHVTAEEGTVAHPDITLGIAFQPLANALRTRDPSKAPPGPFTVTAHTSKGRTAFDLLRSRLGL